MTGKASHVTPAGASKRRETRTASTPAPTA